MKMIEQIMDMMMSEISRLRGTIMGTLFFKALGIDKEIKQGITMYKEVKKVKMVEKEMKKELKMEKKKQLMIENGEDAEGWESS